MRKRKNNKIECDIINLLNMGYTKDYIKKNCYVTDKQIVYIINKYNVCYERNNGDKLFEKLIKENMSYHEAFAIANVNTRYLAKKGYFDELAKDKNFDEIDKLIKTKEHVKIIEMIYNNKSYDSIIDTGLTRNKLIYVVNHYNVKKPICEKRLGMYRNIMSTINLYSEGYKIKEISKILGISITSVYKYLFNIDANESLRILNIVTEYDN